jgi:hypothetical protein
MVSRFSTLEEDIMVTLSVNGVSIDPGNEAEINRAVNAWKAKGIPVCVQLRIKSADLDIILTTDACGSTGGGGGRPPNHRESQVFELWRRKGLQTGLFAGGELIAFMRQVG